MNCNSENKAINLTPKQIVTAKYPQAKSGKDVNGRYVIFTPDKILGLGGNANMAWRNAADFVSKISAENIQKKTVSKRRQRIINKINCGSYNVKTENESLNVFNRNII